MSATDTHLPFFFLQLVVIIVTTHLLAGVAERVGQARVIGEVIAGVLLGPSGLGLLFPDVYRFTFQTTPSESLYFLGQTGLVLLMFQLGAEMDFSQLEQRKNRVASVAVAMSGLALPFALGASIAWASWPFLAPAIPRLGYVLFCGVALSITAVPVLGRILLDLDFARTYVGGIAMTAAMITDVTGWFILAAVVSVVAAGFDPLGFVQQLALFGGYVFIGWKIVRPLLRRLVAFIESRSGGSTLGSTPVVLAAVLVSGLATLLLGLHSAFGGFLMGLLLRDQTELIERWKRGGGTLVNVLFVPVFFAYAGLRMDIGKLSSWSYLPWFLLFLGAAILGKFGGCYAAGRWFGLSSTQARVVGILMNTRGLMELIVLAIGYELGVIPREVYTMLVLMAILTTLMTAPLLKRWAPALGLSPAPPRWERHGEAAAAVARPRRRDQSSSSSK